MLKRNTVVLVLVAIVLVIAVLVLNQVDQQRQEQELAASRLLTLSPGEVTQIRIEEQAEDGADPIQLQRQDQQWQILEPITSAADEATIDSLLEAAADLTPAASLEPSATGSDLEPFGLDPAQKTLRFVTESGEQVLRLGNPDFDGSGVYALAEDGRLVTIARSAESRLSPDLFALRDKTLLALQREQIQSLRIRRQDEEDILLVQTDQGWHIEEPRQLEADQTAVNGVINPLLSLRASSFAAETQDDLADFGLESPQTELIVTLKAAAPSEDPGQKEESVRIALGDENEAGAVYVSTSTSDTVATLSPAVVQNLQPDLTQLRDKQLAQLEPETITAVTVVAEDQSLNRMFLPTPSTPSDSEEQDEQETQALQAPAADPTSERLWEVSDQTERLVSLDPLFRALNQARATDFIDPRDPRVEEVFEDPTLTLELSLQEETEDQIFRFGQEQDQIWAQVPEQEDILVLDSATFATIRSALEELKPE